jgi:hypothetical protein
VRPVNKTRKALKLSSETVRNLSISDMRVVIGGKRIDTWTNPSGGSSCETCGNCPTDSCFQPVLVDSEDGI